MRRDATHCNISLADDEHHQIGFTLRPARCRQRLAPLLEAQRAGRAGVLRGGGNHPQDRCSKLSVCIAQIIDCIEVVTSCLHYHFRFHALLS